jgi:hypothetical protein
MGRVLGFTRIPQDRPGESIGGIEMAIREAPKGPTALGRLIDPVQPRDQILDRGMNDGSFGSRGLRFHHERQRGARGCQLLGLARAA